MKTLSGKTTQRLPISGTNGKVLKTEEEQAKRWKEHFSAILNCPEPTIIHDFSCDAVNTLKINTEAITEEEIRKAIKRLKIENLQGLMAYRLNC